MRYGAVAALAAQFPPLETAHPDGFLCLGGDLRPERLLAAYSRGIFPWYEEGLPVLWWSPDPRCVLPLEAFHLPRRSARSLRRRPFALTLDRAFGRVIRSCAAPRAAAP
uniref:leucyl/phenylalanyl-tRNA--protein transferase n=1 Tax=Desulfovibrio legallii TaxID=571438 RepID=UPI003A8F2554